MFKDAFNIFLLKAGITFMLKQLADGDWSQTEHTPVSCEYQKRERKNEKERKKRRKIQWEKKEGRKCFI